LSGISIAPRFASVVIIILIPVVSPPPTAAVADFRKAFVSVGP
jgi:hypothetical protein